MISKFGKVMIYVNEPRAVDSITFNFSDIEGNYFAVQEIIRN